MTQSAGEHSGLRAYLEARALSVSDRLLKIYESDLPRRLDGVLCVPGPPDQPMSLAWAEAAPRGTDATTVLSEGEQTALGLAGFFTEAHFDASKSAIVFDDPVTSLDHVRRDKVAKRLAELAADRQVVVFTHDIAFVGNLVAAAKEADVDLTERSVERQGPRPGVCVQTFPWKAKDFASRLDHLRTDLAKLTRERGTLL